MKARGILLPRVAVAFVALGLLGAVTYVFFWNPQPTRPVVDFDASSNITTGQLEKVGGLRVFFGHMSVGNNILNGVGEVFEAAGVGSPEVVEITPAEVPTLTGEPVLMHALIGQNYDPVGKLRNFDVMLRAGLAEGVDVAMLKFCYVDINGETDVDALFAHYRETLGSLEQDFPEVRFVHMTVPLTTATTGIKGYLKKLAGRDHNPARERYNDLMRAAYGSDELLDVAAIESTAPDGSRTHELYPGYTSDGEHLNDAGSALVAGELMRLLAGPGR